VESKGKKFLSIEEDRQIIRVLRFMREYMHISTRDLASMMAGEYHSRSLVASIENGTRNPNANFVADYAMAIQKKSGLKGNLLLIIQKCLEDDIFLEQLDKYEKNDISFRTIYLMSKKICEKAK